MKICNQCGNQVDDSVMFCGNCGYQFTTQQNYQGNMDMGMQQNYQPSMDMNMQQNYQANMDMNAQQNYQQGYQQPYYDQNYQQNYYGQNSAMNEMQNGYAYSNQGNGSQVAAAPQSGLGVAAFILSFFVAPVGLILGIVARAKRDGKRKGLATAAIIVSSILSVVWILMFAVLIPEMVKYNEKTKVSSDTQFCDTFKTAITTAMMDPSVINNDYWSIYYFSDGGWHDISELGGSTDSYTFCGAIQEIVGFDPAYAESYLKSSYLGGRASGMQFRISGYSVEVRIQYSDSTGRKGRYGAYPITVD